VGITGSCGFHGRRSPYWFVHLSLLANGSIYIADDYWASLLKSQVLQRLKYQTAKKKWKFQ
jgi:hypothetical protein